MRMRMRDGWPGWRGRNCGRAGGASVGVRDLGLGRGADVSVGRNPFPQSDTHPRYLVPLFTAFQQTTVYIVTISSHELPTLLSQDVKL